MKTIKILLILTVITAITCLSLSGCFLSELANSTIPSIGDSESAPENSESDNQDNDENQENSNENETDTDSNNLGSETGENEESASPVEENDNASSHTPIPDYVNQILSSGEYMEQEVMVRIESGNINEIVGEINAEVIETLPEISAFRISIPPELSVAAAIEILVNNESVVYAEPNGIFYLNSFPNDSYYNNGQWAPQLTGAEAAWNNSITGSGITIAITDTGIDGTHEDFKDQGGNSRVISGYDTYHEVSIAADSNSDLNGHGTHCAGIAAATGNNGIGIAGLAWEANIMPVKVFNDNIIIPSASSGDVAEGIIWAVNNGADIISCSLGGRGTYWVVKDAIDLALSNNRTVFAAMGNSSTGEILYPAGYQGVIAVGSTNAHDEISDSSTTGSHMSICAPGEEILSTVPGGYSYASGTSMACPFATGAAALLLSHDSSLTPYDLKTRLENSAVDLGPTGFDSTYGYGRIDIERAITNDDTSDYGSVDVWVFWRGMGIIDNIEYASVILWQNDEVVATTDTTSDGHAVFNYLPAGDYQVSASHPLYHSSLAENNPIKVIAGEITAHEIQLELRP
jgi:subtilisin family serine protease